MLIDQKVTVKWSHRNKKHYINQGFVLTGIGEPLIVYPKNLSKGSRQEVICKCDECDNEFPKKYSEVYGIEAHFCNRECQGKWQSRTRIGENASNYKQEFSREERRKVCIWCEDVFYVSPHDIDKSIACKKECREKWYANVWSKRQVWRDESRIRAVKMLEDGVFGKDSNAQKITNMILDDIGIAYKNEYGCKYVAIDNYLVDSKLMIEVMGDYWHTNPNVYDKIQYQQQYDRVIADKRKRAIIKANYGIDILYLWESDLNNDPEMCKNLIMKYIHSRGDLENYHSINYTYKDGMISLFDNQKAYFELPLLEIKNRFEIKPKTYKKVKNKDKWTTFNCDNCGKEKDQLTSHYKKSKTHCCSKECKSILQQNGESKTLGHIVSCSNCGDEFKVTNYRYLNLKNGKTKNIFCNYDCRNNWQKENLKCENNPNSFKYKNRRSG